MEFGSFHESVLPEETLSYWVGDPGGWYLDGTVGGGGHADLLLSRFASARLIGLDRDPEALEFAGRRLSRYADRVKLVRSDFAAVERVLEDLSRPPIAGILLDLGVSSRQLDDPDRGFSYRSQGPLRLVLDRDAARGASEWMAGVSEEELKHVLRDYGEVPGAGRVARLLVESRAKRPFRTTGDLVAVLERAGIRSPRRLSQVFQAVRIAVNRELESLQQGLDAAARVLPPGGTLTVISFESLMDRMVKRAFRPQRTHKPLAGEPEPPALWQVLTRGAVRPGEAETAKNPRSRSARLRAARRTEHVLV